MESVITVKKTLLKKRIIWQRKLINFVLILVLFFSMQTNVWGQDKRHIVAYGVIENVSLIEIAQNCDILIVSDVTSHQAKTLRKLNPNIKILKYHNAIYVNRIDPKWIMIDSKKEWFARDKTNNRIELKRFKAYLMNMSNIDMRVYRITQIIEGTPDYYDGIFLDDCHEYYPAYFSSVGIIPKAPDIAENWSKNIIDILCQLRSAYPKLLIINGSFEKYLKYVDGCMMEDFVHTNEDPDVFFRTPSQVVRILEKVEQLKKRGKFILLQSGTLAEGLRNNEKIFKYCFAAYLLVANDKTSFGFQQGRGYYFRRMPSYMHINALTIGTPSQAYRIIQRNIDHMNYLNNGSFSLDFNNWTIISGTPRIKRIESHGKRMAVHLSGHSKGNSDMIASEFIPISALNDYTISLKCKSIRNVQGSAGWKKLGLLGRFYDKNKHMLPGAYDLQLDHGSYDWQPFDASFRSPENAKYFKLSIGFIGDGSGEGLISDISFTLSKNIELSLSRQFTNGIAILNPTRNQFTINFRHKKENHSATEIIDALTGSFLAYDEIIPH